MPQARVVPTDYFWLEVATTLRSILRKTTNSSVDSADNCRRRVWAVSMSFTASTQWNVPLRSFFKISKIVFILSVPAGLPALLSSGRGWNWACAGVRWSLFPSGCGKHRRYQCGEQYGFNLRAPQRQQKPSEEDVAIERRFWLL